MSEPCESMEEVTPFRHTSYAYEGEPGPSPRHYPSDRMPDSRPSHANPCLQHGPCSGGLETPIEMRRVLALDLAQFSMGRFDGLTFRAATSTHRWQDPWLRAR